MAEFKTYSLLLACVDNRLQRQEQRIDLRRGFRPEEDLLRVTWAVPSDGFEFDPRPHLGTDRRFRVSVFRTTESWSGPAEETEGPPAGCELVFQEDLLVVGVRLTHAVNRESRLTVDFAREAPRDVEEP